MNASSFDTEPRLDKSMVAQIREWEAIRPGLLEHLTTVFQSNFKQLMESMDSQLADDNHDSLRIAFHSLKGAAASLGAVRLSKMAGFAESLAANEFDDASFAETCSALKTEFEYVRMALLEAQQDQG